MILGNLAEAMEFLPSVNMTVANGRFTDFFRRSQSWLVSRVLGAEIETALEEEFDTEDDSHAALRRLCRRVIAGKALLDAIPEMDMQLTEAGFAVQQNDNFTPASSQRVDRLVGMMPERIANDVDMLVDHLVMATKDGGYGSALYDGWRGTEQYKRLTAAFMPTMRECSSVQGHPVFKDYDEFYSALPSLYRSMKETAGHYVSPAEIDRLLELFRDGDTLEIHRRAIEELKVAAVASAAGAVRRARSAAASAREIMMSSPGDFPAFRNSSAFSSLNVNLDGGRIVNFT